MRRFLFSTAFVNKCSEGSADSKKSLDIESFMAFYLLANLVAYLYLIYILVLVLKTAHFLYAQYCPACASDTAAATDLHLTASNMRHMREHTQKQRMATLLGCE